ncbi:hypothetical protein [Nocardia sp. NPDC005825]|uniref:hypothetical protein n=1 Tax=unclassified Nocardia TaxID=2637762 RepID=UPI0033EE2DE4
MDVVTESTRYATACINCGSVTESTITEALVGEDHRWDIEGRCSACGAVWADCGYRQPLAGFREAILAANGSTVLELGPVPVPTAAVMRALRVTQPLSLTQARTLTEKLQQTGLEGTRVEMEIIARQLRATGVHVGIRPSRR